MGDNKKNILVIDGSYIGHRSVYALGKIINKDISLDTQEEMLLFESQYKSDLISLAKTFDANVRLDGVVVFIDNKSWRHSVTPYKPYYINDDSSEDHKILSYKGNRAKAKEKSKIDYDNLNYCMRHAGEQLDLVPGFHVSQLPGFEADDGIYLTAHKLSDLFNVFIFANDGDISQAVVNKNVFYFNNSKSKEKPNNCIYVDRSLKLPRLIKNPLDLLRYRSQHELQLLGLISKIEIGTDRAGTLNRSFESNSIDISLPKYFGLVKSIIGDKKDNIKPIIGWFSATGRMGRVLEKDITIAIAGLATTVDFDDDLKSQYGSLFASEDFESIAGFIVSDILNCDRSLNLNELTKLFLMSLLGSTKQKGIASGIFNHLKHNINMMMLSVGSVKELGLRFDSEVTPKIMNLTIQKLILDNSNISNAQKIDILHTSIPDDNLVKPKGDLVDDILNSL